jgi:hypothetical protein
LLFLFFLVVRTLWVVRVVAGELAGNTKKAAGVSPGGLVSGSSRSYEKVTWDRRGRGLWKVAGTVHGIDHEARSAMRSFATPPT